MNYSTSSPSSLLRRSQLLRLPLTTIQKLAEREKAERRLIDFVKLCWPILEPRRQFVWGWHIDAICEHLEAITDGQLQYLLINVPPGSMKSMLTDVFWPLWEWGPCNLPSMRYFCAAYTQGITIRDNQRFLNCCTSDVYQEMWGDRFQLTHEAATKLINDKTGWKLATSTEGLGTGERGDRIIVDDPHNVIEAESAIERQNVLNWFNESLPLRINDPKKSAFVVIMQRVHENDVSGEILANELGYCHLMIPMEFDTRRVCITSLGWQDPRTEEGELYWPDHFDPDWLTRMKRQLGRFGTAAQLQQSPMPKGGNIFREEDWKCWPPHGTDEEQKTRFPDMDFVVCSVDTAMTEREENDESAISIWGVWRDWAKSAVPAEYRDSGQFQAMSGEPPPVAMPRLMLKYAWSGHVSFKALIDKLMALCKQHHVDVLLVEGKNNGYSVVQEVMRLNVDQSWATYAQPVKGDKVARAHSVVHFWENGLVWAPDRDWASKMIEQCAVFPKGKRDDLVDTATMAMQYLRQQGLIAIESERQIDAARALIAGAHPSASIPPAYDL